MKRIMQVTITSVILLALFLPGGLKISGIDKSNAAAWDLYNVRDLFNSQSYSNNNGTVNWASNWVDANDGTGGSGPAAGNVQVTNLTGNNETYSSELMIGNDGDAYIQRIVNLSSANYATLTFDFRETGSSGTGDILTIQVSTNGTTWFSLGTITGTSDSGSRSYSLNSYLNTTTYIRFAITNTWETGEYVYIDNVDITYGLAAFTCISRSISASSDDAQQTGTAVNFTNTTVEIPQNSIWWGLRFQNVAIANEADIAKAYLTFRARGTNANTSGMTMYGNDIDNAVTFTTGINNISNRTRTAASAAWSISAWETNDSYDSVDVTPLVQEIIDRGGWNSGNSLAILGQATVDQDKIAEAYDSTYDFAPELTICYLNLDPTADETVSGPEVAVTDEHVQVTWQTVNEVDILGFRLYRDGQSENEMIFMRSAEYAGKPMGYSYFYDDLAVDPLGTHVYWLEVVTAHGAYFLQPGLVNPYRIFLPVSIH